MTSVVSVIIFVLSFIVGPILIFFVCHIAQGKVMPDSFLLTVRLFLYKLLNRYIVGPNRQV